MRLSTYPHFLAYYLGGTAMRRQLREQSHEPEEEPGAKARAFEVAEQSIQKALQKHGGKSKFAQLAKVEC